MFTYAQVKWFYSQSEHTYYLNYFIINNVNLCFLLEGKCLFYTSKNKEDIAEL